MVLRLFAVLVATLIHHSAMAQSDAFRLSLEEPVQGQTHSGVSNLRGWAIGNSPIERIAVDIDGVYAFDAPYGGLRADVGSTFPDVPNSSLSGFSLAFNYSDLTAGDHTIRATAHAADGSTLAAEATFTVVRFPTSFIADPAQVDLSTAQCVINDQTLHILDAAIEGVATDVSLRWRTATQGFEVEEIR